MRVDPIFRQQKPDKPVIVIVWHAAVVPEYRKLVSVLPEICSEYYYVLICPVSWREHGSSLSSAGSAEYHQGWCFIPLQTVFRGISKHIYLSINKLLDVLRPVLIDVIEEASSLAVFQIHLWCKKNGIPFLFNTAENIPKKKNIMHRWIEKNIFQSSSGAVIRNPYAESILILRGFTRPVVFIGNGINTEIFYPSAPKGELLAKYRAHHIRIIGFVGKMLPEKGILDLIDVFADLSERKKIQSTALLIIGTGVLEKKINNRLSEFSESIQKSIFCLPHVPNDDLPDYYRMFDLLIMPSRRYPGWEEPFGRVAVEAMACGCPVLGSDSGYIPEIVSNPDLIFKANNMRELSAKIQLLINDTELRKKAADTAPLLASRFSWNDLSVVRINFYKKFI